MHFDFPSPGFILQLRSLWVQAFGDSDTFLDSFFELCYSPSRCRCVVRNGEVLSALYWFDMDCRGQKMAYLYAVATREDARHQGLCRELMEDTKAVLLSQGYAAAILCPENAGLARMYAAWGYRPVCRISEWTEASVGSPIPLRRVSPEEYRHLRKLFLPEGSAQPEACFFSMLSREAELYAGEDLLLAARREADHLFVPELLGNARSAPGVLAALNCREGTFRAPGDTREFAMFLPLVPGSQPPAYFGLALD